MVIMIILRWCEEIIIPVEEEAGNNVLEEKTPEIIDDDDCPVPFNSAQYEDPDVTMRKKVHGKKPETIDSDDAPLPPSHVAALYEHIVYDNEGTDEKLMKKKLEAENTTNQTHHVAEVASSQSSQQQSQRSAPTISASSEHHQHAEIIRRPPPPPSMLVNPHGDGDEEGASTSLAAIQTDHSAHCTLMIEATRVSDVSDAPVYDATPVQEEVGGMEENKPWWKRNRKLLGMVLVLIAGLAATIGLLFEKDDGDQELGGKNSPSEIPIIPQTNTESPVISQTNATAEVSLSYLFTVILDQINCFHTFELLT